MAALDQYSPGFRLIDGGQLNDMVDQVNNLTGNGTPGAVAATTVTATTVNSTTTTSTNTATTGTESATPQILSAAGATQGAATAITKSTAIITVCTASARGVKLPTAVTGLLVRLLSLCTQGTKVYPFAGDRIGSAATNAAVVIAGFKGNLYVAKDASRWALLTGA